MSDNNNKQVSVISQPSKKRKTKSKTEKSKSHITTKQVCERFKDDPNDFIECTKVIDDTNSVCIEIKGHYYREYTLVQEGKTNRGIAPHYDIEIKHNDDPEKVHSIPSSIIHSRERCHKFACDYWKIKNIETIKNTITELWNLPSPYSVSTSQEKETNTPTQECVDQTQDIHGGVVTPEHTLQHNRVMTPESTLQHNTDQTHDDVKISSPVHSTTGESKASESSTTTNTPTESNAMIIHRNATPSDILQRSPIMTEVEKAISTPPGKMEEGEKKTENDKQLPQKRKEPEPDQTLDTTPLSNPSLFTPPIPTPTTPIQQSVTPLSPQMQYFTSKPPVIKKVILSGQNTPPLSVVDIQKNRPQFTRTPFQLPTISNQKETTTLKYPSSQINANLTPLQPITNSSVSIATTKSHSSSNITPQRSSQKFLLGDDDEDEQADVYDNDKTRPEKISGSFDEIDNTMNIIDFIPFLSVDPPAHNQTNTLIVPRESEGKDRLNGLIEANETLVKQVVEKEKENIRLQQEINALKDSKVVSDSKLVELNDHIKTLEITLATASKKLENIQSEPPKNNPAIDRGTRILWEAFLSVMNPQFKLGMNSYASMLQRHTTLIKQASDALDNVYATLPPIIRSANPDSEICKYIDQMEEEQRVIQQQLLQQQQQQYQQQQHHQYQQQQQHQAIYQMPPAYTQEYLKGIIQSGSHYIPVGDPSDAYHMTNMGRNY